MRWCRDKGATINRAMVEAARGGQEAIVRQVPLVGRHRRKWGQGSSRR